MLYLEWFEALKALAFGGGRLTEISDVQRLGVMFLGNMLTPHQTHIIRLGEYGELKFAPNDGELGSHPKYYLEDFHLPSDGVVLEDTHSSIGLVDLEPGARGLCAPRIYIYIERPTRDWNKPVSSLFELLQLVGAELALPSDGFFTSWGLIKNVQNMNIAEEPYFFEFMPFGNIAFSSSGVTHLRYNAEFLRMKGVDIPGVDTSAVPVEELYSHDLADSMVGNLHFSFLQVAYHNWLVDNQ